MVDLPNLGDLDPGQLQQMLPGVDFPAQKDEIVSSLQSNGAPQELIDKVSNSGKDQFNSADEVLQTAKG